MRYLKLFEEYDREASDVSLFTKDERDLIEDVLLLYVDKYNMVDMPSDEDGIYFDEDLDRIQFCVQRLRNIGIDIESPLSISLSEIYRDMSDSFVKRIERLGFKVFWCGLKEYDDRNTISITIMKPDGYKPFE